MGRYLDFRTRFMVICTYNRTDKIYYNKCNNFVRVIQNGLDIMTANGVRTACVKRRTNTC